MSAAAPPTTALAGAAEARLPREQTWENGARCRVARTPPSPIPAGGCGSRRAKPPPRETRGKRRSLPVRKYLSVLIPGGVLALIVLLTLLAPVIAPYEPNAIDMKNALSGPTREHWLGTDQLGRDQFTRLLYGGGPPLIVFFFALVGDLLVGGTIGLTNGSLFGQDRSALSCNLPQVPLR